MGLCCSGLKLIELGGIVDGKLELRVLSLDLGMAVLMKCQLFAWGWDLRWSYSTAVTLNLDFLTIDHSVISQLAKCITSRRTIPGNSEDAAGTNVQRIGSGEDREGEKGRKASKKVEWIHDFGMFEESILSSDP